MEEYESGWQWASDRWQDHSAQDIHHDAFGAAMDSTDPDMFYEGAMDYMKEARKAGK